MFHASHEVAMKAKSVLDPSFRYVSSINTDLRKTFARIRREQRRQHQQSEATTVRAPTVLPLTYRKSAAR
jgi:hypothetical protein